APQDRCALRRGPVAVQGPGKMPVVLWVGRPERGRLAVPASNQPTRRLMEKLALSFAAVALVSGAAQAATPAYPDNPDVIWKGNFEGGAASLSGNCSYGDNGWCNE